MGGWDNITKVKTKMAFTDLMPSLNFNPADGFGIKSQLERITKFLFPTDAEYASMSLLEKAQDRLEGIDFLITMIKNPVISLFVNPQNITVNKNILVNKQVTRGGFVMQFWGHDLETINVQAETGYFGLSKVPLRAFELFKNHCYQGRYHKRKPFRALPIITMMYEGEGLKGYFNNLTYTIVKERPYIITYSFTFTVVEKVSIPFLSFISNVYEIFKKDKYDTGKTLRERTTLFSRGWGVKLY